MSEGLVTVFWHTSKTARRGFRLACLPSHQLCASRLRQCRSCGSPRCSAPALWDQGNPSALAALCRFAVRRSMTKRPG